jgi:hypothetical protein
MTNILPIYDSFMTTAQIALKSRFYATFRTVEFKIPVTSNQQNNTFMTQKTAN